MTTNTNAAIAEDLQDTVSKALRRAWQLGQTYWQQADSEYTSQHRKADETQGKFDALIEETRAALSTAAQPPAGFVLVPTELAERVQETMGEFLMDHGWRQQDMDTSDEFDAALAAAAPASAAKEQASRQRSWHDAEHAESSTARTLPPWSCGMQSAC